MRAQYGYMGKMLFVDLTQREVHEEELASELARRYVGGYGIGARILLDRMEPGAEPLGPGNLLGIGTGPFTGTGAISTSRFITFGKSPLTGYWGDANSGGNFAPALKAAGYDLVFFQGRAEHPVYLLVTDHGVQIRDARHLWGLDTVRTEESIRQENGIPSLKVACVGPAGEKRARIAAIVNDGGRAAARSGLGAVMGAKNVKALACAGAARPKVFDKARVQQLNRAMTEELRTSPGPMAQVLSAFGTPGAMVPHLAVHAVPLKNFGGNFVEDFPAPRWAKVGYDALAKHITKKYACSACPIACGGVMNVEGGRYPVKNGHKPEYETLAAFGPNCLVDDMEALLYANELCNLNGLDTISAGATVAFAIECFENGLLTERDTDGLELRWGNADAVIGLLEKICRREGVGDLLADGAREAARKLGRGAERFSMDVGGELIPMHDPREAPGWGATYVADPTPARHTRGGTQFAESGIANPNLMGLLGLPVRMEKFEVKGKGRVHATLRAWHHLINNAGLCLFGHDAVSLYPMREMFQAVAGWQDVTVEELVETGKRIATLLHAFNLREGFRPGEFTMPSRVAGDPPFQVGPFKDLAIDFEALKREYYAAMGFDAETGEIPAEVLGRYGL